MTVKEIAALDKKIEALKPKLIKAKESYDDLADQMSALLDQRYPERKEEAIKNRLYEAYSKNGKSVYFIEYSDANTHAFRSFLTPFSGKMISYLENAQFI